MQKHVNGLSSENDRFASASWVLRTAGRPFLPWKGSIRRAGASLPAMSGIEVAASAAGLVSLSLTLFNGCIQAFQHIEKAAQLGGDADVIRCKLEWEQYRLYQWAEQAGLEDSPNNRLNWSMASNVLKQLEALLTSSEALKERYHLNVEEESPSRSQSQWGDPAKAPPSPSFQKSSAFSIILAKLKPKYASSSARIIQESNTSIKKLEWASVGRDKLTGLVDDISYFNNCLHSLLELSDRVFVNAALSALLRDVISRSNVSSELDVVKELLRSTSVASSEAVACAASLKKIRLILGLGKEGVGAQQSNAHAGESVQRLKLTQLKPKHLVRESMYNHPRGREIARYKSDLVLIEWRFLHRSAPPHTRSRIDQIAICLSNTDESSFRSLHCLGVLPNDPAYQPEDETQICHGLVFQLPVPKNKSVELPFPIILPLSGLYTRARKPSLNERLFIAYAMAETVLQLHTTGWLHKGIRPDNILFLQVGNQTWKDGTAKGPYLAGYDYARPSNAETETVPGEPAIDLYRHPLAQGPARLNFNKTFDLFALGCVLLEVALWTDLKDILRQIYEQEHSGRNVEKQTAHKGETIRYSEWDQINEAKEMMLSREKANDDLANVAFHAGETFKEVISLCLFAANNDTNDESLDVQKDIVEKLTDCKF